MTIETVLKPRQILHLWDTRVGEPCDKHPLTDADKLHFARAIEQAVLQSEQVQAWKKDAERYRAWRQAAIDEDTIFLDAAYKYQQDNFPEGSPTAEQFDAGLDYAIDAAMEKQP